MRVLLLSFLVGFASSLPAADTWPEFRGPTADGHSDCLDVPVEWSESENVRWKVAIHGRAWSTPIVSKSKVWLTSATPDGRELFVIIVDRETGKVLKDEKLFTVEKPRPLGNSMNSYGTPTAVLDGDHIFISFGSYGTASLRVADGSVVWSRRDLPCNHFRGPASSPILYENRLILHMDGSDHHYVVALDKKNGKTLWKTERSTDYRDLDTNGKPKRDGDFRKAFNTPIIVPRDGVPVLVSPAARAAYGYDARSGKELWQVTFPGHSTASRTVVWKDLAMINTGYAKAELWAVRLGGKGDVTKTHVAWKRKRQIPNRSSPLLVDGMLYMVTDKGIASCLDPATGEPAWVERLGGNYSASPIYVGELIYFFNHEGVATVIRPGKTFDLVVKNKLADGFMASPAVAGRALYLRTRSHLYRIEEPE